MKRIITLFVAALYLCFPQIRAEEAVSQAVQTPYSEQKVVFDFYFDEPEKINSALYWIRSLINPLMDEPYGRNSSTSRWSFTAPNL